jgi:diguanylate cyclase (GGDEF)-like protein/PAS domain S-box-containing protein
MDASMSEIKINSVLTSLEIPEDILMNWQRIVDLLADILNIPSALIMRVHSHEIEVFTKSSNKENVYKVGERALLDTGLYCETVMSTQQELLVPNALKDPLWKYNPDVDLGMISYCGLPLTWPTGKIFGTICILDSETNQFSGHARDLLERFQESLQYNLANIYEINQDKYRYIKSEQENQELVAKYTSLIKSIPAVTYTVALDESNTTLFISEQIEALLGFTPAQFKSTPGIWLRQLHSGDRKRIRQETHESYKSHLPLVCEYRMLDSKDNIKWIRDEANIVKDKNGTPVCLQGLMYDITARKKIELREKSRSQVLELIASDELLPVVLEAIVRGVEQENPEMLCSILLLDEKGTHLLNGAAPSLHAFYNEAIHGVAIGVGVGSCGTSAFTGERVIVDDIQNHPYWTDFKKIASKAGLAACWSEPIYATNGKVLGTFAIYHHDVHLPTEAHITLIEQTTSLASIAIEHIQTKLTLQSSEERYALAMEGTQDGLWDWNVSTNEILFSPRWKSMLGYTENEIKDEVSEWERLVHPDDLAITILCIKTFLSHKTNQYKAEFRMQHKDGQYINILSRAFSSEDEAGEVTRLVGTHVDITERKLSEEKLKLAASVFRHAGESIAITDVNGMILDINDTFSNTTGFSREEAIGKNPRLLKSGRQPPEFYADMWEVLLIQGYWSGELWNRRKNGEVYAEMKTISAVRDEQGLTTHYVALGNDITQMKEHQDKLEHIAHYDILTNLPNRVLLSDRLSQAMLQCSRQEQSLAVVVLDLDGFKLINDAYGHNVGDELLIALSLRMKEVLREVDNLARIGGDEFVVVLADLIKLEDCEPVLERLLLSASEPFTIGDNVLNVSASIGVTLYPQDNVDADQLMRHADQAMYVAKESGKNRYHLFDTAQDDAIKIQRASLEAIRNALDNNQFLLYYQPKVNMKKGTVVGVEALIRWQHPERGLLNPIDFLPVIENNPMMIEMGEWVIDSALTQISQWQATGLNLPISTSVNIAAVQLQQPDFTQVLTALLAAHPDVEPRHLELEVLETSALDDVHHISTIMNDCMALGVSFALDDFGTGYSSLTYLRRLPANLIKIDQTFVRDMLNDADDLAIVEGVIALAKSFKRDVIAEGVETIEHGTVLLQLGCELAQGYGIARPMPASDIPAWVKDWKPDVSWLL